MDYKSKYLKYKSKYLELQNILQKGGDANVSYNYRREYEQTGKKFNSLHINDKKIWTAGINDNIALGDTEQEFHESLVKLMRERNGIRQVALDKLMSLNKVYDGNEEDYLLDYDFISYFFNYIYRGSTKKLYYPIGIDLEYPETLDVFSEVVDIQSTFSNAQKHNQAVNSGDGVKITAEQGKEIRHFIFLDKINPCHISQQVNKFKGKHSNVLIFNAGKVLGKGAAGKAMLLNYKNTIDKSDKGKNYLALKIMDGSIFNLQNGGTHLDVDIVYFHNKNEIIFPHYTQIGKRYALPNKLLDYYNSSWSTADKSYKDFNVFKTDDVNYTHCYPAVRSDNFTNQTILSMIINNILSKKNINNYVHQYDAFLCLDVQNTAEINNESSSDVTSFMKNILSGTKIISNYIFESVANKLGTSTENVKLNGVTIMEVANKGDLDGYIRQKETTVFRDFLHNDLSEQYNDVNDFFNCMMEQILKPLSVLHNAKYAFVHGDMKSKNIFVHETEAGEVIYKLADFDKSSITYNGVRFHNDGSLGIRIVRMLAGKSLTDLKDPSSWVGRLKNIFKSNNSITEELTDDSFLNYLEKDKGDYYTISGNVVDLSRYGFLQVLEKVEIEQMMIRYLPIPYYQTIDIYTLFCSLFFTKLFYRFIKISYDKDDDKMKNITYENCAEEYNKLNNNKIYFLFKTLFNREDRITMMKYFDIYYEINLLEPVSINVILDPLKKNNIKLLKKYPIKAMNLIFEDFEKNINDNEQQIALPKTIHLSDGQFGIKHICVNSKPLTFIKKFHRAGHTMYINPERQISVWNTTGFGEAYKGVNSATQKDNKIYSLVFNFYKKIVALDNEELLSLITIFNKILQDDDQDREKEIYNVILDCYELINRKLVRLDKDKLFNIENHKDILDDPNKFYFNKSINSLYIFRTLIIIYYYLSLSEEDVRNDNYIRINLDFIKSTPPSWLSWGSKAYPVIVNILKDEAKKMINNNTDDDVEIEYNRVMINMLYSYKNIPYPKDDKEGILNIHLNIIKTMVTKENIERSNLSRLLDDIFTDNNISKLIEEYYQVVINKNKNVGDQDGNIHNICKVPLYVTFPFNAKFTWDTKSGQQYDEVNEISITDFIYTKLRN